jgi:hypothetical protein
MLNGEDDVDKKDSKKGKNKAAAGIKKGKGTSKSLKHAIVEEDSLSSEDKLNHLQIIDFDKLIGDLKFEKKMVEICVGRKSHETKHEVCLVQLCRKQHLVWLHMTAWLLVSALISCIIEWGELPSRKELS